MVSLGAALGRLVGPGRRRAWRRRVLRKLVAAGCACTAVVAVLAVSRSDRQAPTAEVLVATRALEAGAVVRSADVRVARWPAEVVAGSWALRDAQAAEGRVLTGPLAPGQPLTAGGLLGPGLLQGQPPGTVAVHVPLPDPAALRMVGPGDRVDLLSLRGEALAEAAVVLAVDAGGGDGVDGAVGSGWGPGSVGGEAAGITVSAQAEVAQRLAAHLASGFEAPPVTLALHRR